jgi:small multidrug resistance family-3 protein
MSNRVISEVLVWLAFLLSALLEVAGDAAVRRGLLGRSLVFVLLGCAVLGCYGLMVNSVKWDFSKLIGVYVGFFALVSVLFGRIVLREQIPPSTWWGLALVIAGGLLIQFGGR